MFFKITFQLFLLLLFSNNLKAQTTVYALGLQRPLGFELDGRGWLWVCEHGTLNNDGRVSIVTTDGQVHPFLIGLPSTPLAGDESTGPTHCYFDIDGKLLVLTGLRQTGNDSLLQSMLVIDTTGFVPGDTPLTRDDIEAVYHIESLAPSNPYTMAIGPNDDYYLADATRNMIVKLERSSGIISVFANFPNIPNLSQQGPPMIHTVPTSILFDQANSRFLVGSLTGFPFPGRGAKIYQVDLSGSITNFINDLTTVIEIQIDPLDGKIVALKHGDFNATWVHNSGAVIKIINNQGALDTLVSGLERPTGMRFDRNGSIYVSEYSDGEILKINTATDVKANEIFPQYFALYQNYPNPFNPSTVISYQLPVGGHVSLKVFDILGREISTLVNEIQPAGNYEIRFDGSSAGGGLSSGVYLYRLEAGNFVSTKKLILMR